MGVDIMLSSNQSYVLLQRKKGSNYRFCISLQMFGGIKERRLKVPVLWPPERQAKSSEHDISTSQASPIKIQSLTLYLMQWLMNKDRKTRNVLGLNSNSIWDVPKCHMTTVLSQINAYLWIFSFLISLNSTRKHEDIHSCLSNKWTFVPCPDLSQTNFLQNSWILSPFQLSIKQH